VTGDSQGSGLLRRAHDTLRTQSVALARRAAWLQTRLCSQAKVQRIWLLTQFCVRFLSHLARHRPMAFCYGVGRPFIHRRV
jgi:hypothetical protein